jgi:hypothetical protein
VRGKGGAAHLSIARSRRWGGQIAKRSGGGGAGVGWLAADTGVRDHSGTDRAALS